MNEYIQNEIVNSEQIFDIYIRIDFKNETSNLRINEIDERLTEELAKLSIGFGGGQGKSFISGTFLNFGKVRTFDEVRRTINNILISEKKIIENLHYFKHLYNQERFDFISDLNMNFNEILLKTKNVFKEIKFCEITIHENNSERKSFSGIDDLKTIHVYVSEIIIKNLLYIRFSIGSQKVNKNEFELLISKIKTVIPEMRQVKWVGFEYDFNLDKYLIPKDGKLFEFLD